MYIRCKTRSYTDMTRHDPSVQSITLDANELRVFYSLSGSRLVLDAVDSTTHRKAQLVPYAKGPILLPQHGSVRSVAAILSR